MILTAHQPVYLPWLGLFHKIALADAYISFDGVQYVPRDWQNRNRIKTTSGPLWLTVPVLDSGYRNKKLHEIEINNALPWRRKHWRTIVSSYAKAPFFDAYADFFERTYAHEWRLLADLNHHMLRWLLETLGLPSQFSCASSHDFHGAKSDLVLDMCQQLKAAHYIFGALGKDYADLDSFQRAGIRVSFQDYTHPVYPQLHGPFVSHLSVIDLLFNCGPDSRNVIMSGNKLYADS